MDIAKNLGMNYATTTGVVERERKRILHQVQLETPVSEIAREYGVPFGQMLVLIDAFREKAAARKAYWDSKEEENDREREAEHLEYGVNFSVNILSRYHSGRDLDPLASEFDIGIETLNSHLGALLRAAKHP